MEFKFTKRNGRIIVTQKFKKRFGNVPKFHMTLLDAGFLVHESTIRGWYSKKRKQIPIVHSYRIIELFENGKI